MKKRIGLLLIPLFTGIFGLTACKQKGESGCRYEINAEYMPESNTVAGTVKCVFKNGEKREQDGLSFNLWGNAYREDAVYRPIPSAYTATAYYEGDSYGSMTITSVNGAKNWEIVGEDANILQVDLPKRVSLGEEVTVDIGFITRLAKVNHRTGRAEKTVNLGNFYPILCKDGDEGFIECPYYSEGDPFLSDCADYTVRFTAPKEYVVASTGLAVSERALESKNEYTYTAQNVRDFALALSTEYKVERCKVGGTELSYYYYDDEKPTAHLLVVKEAFSYFEKAFGDYPYPNYSIAQTGLCFSGMEYPNLTFLGEHQKEQDLVYTLVRETAHQWWYNAVGSDGIRNAWQDEGLSEYSAVLFFDKHLEYGFTESDLVAQATERYRAYFDVYDRVFGEADTRMTRNLKEYLTGYEYASITFDKGLILFHTLKEGMGEKKFLGGLKNYRKKCLFKVATVDDLIGSFERTGVDVSGLFASFLEGKAVI